MSVSTIFLFLSIVVTGIVTLFSIYLVYIKFKKKKCLVCYYAQQKNNVFLLSDDIIKKTIYLY